MKNIKDKIKGNIYFSLPWYIVNKLWEKGLEVSPVGEITVISIIYAQKRKKSKK